MSKNPVEIVDELMVDLAAEIRLSNDTYLKLDFFKETINWAKVKNKINPDEGEGSKINEYRNTLAGTSGSTGRNASNAARKGKRPKTAPQEGEGVSSDYQPNLGSSSGIGLNPGAKGGTFSINDGGLHSGSTNSSGPKLVKTDGEPSVRSGGYDADGVVDDQEGVA